MKFGNPLIVVKDMEKSKEFYRTILGLRVTCDFGANVTLTGGIALQTENSWIQFIEKEEKQIQYQGNDAELYFEEEEFDKLIETLEKNKEIKYVHKVKKHDWEQRAVRFYDPDYHIIEVGEPMKQVCKNLLKQGYTVDEVANKTMLSTAYIKRCTN